MSRALPRPAAPEGFADIWARRSPEELRELAHIKRFMECVRGDPEFRARLEASIDAPAAVARDYGIAVDPARLRPLFQAAYAECRFDPPDDRWPLVRRWDRYCAEVAAALDSLLGVGDTAAVHPRFHRWRRRQIARLASQLGEAARGIVHPIAAYELSQGCSLGCWFCGVSAEKFAGWWPYTPENEKLWRGLLEAMVLRFGAAAQTGFCYWATDPSDNPDYVRFIKAHHEITGFVPQTTTAAPLRNLAQTREILSLFRHTQGIWNRFSILSVGQLRRVHATFTAEELLGVELVLQNRGAMTEKYAAGRGAALRPAGRNANPAGRFQGHEGTIACVSGFLVKPMEGRVELVSPTPAGERWPDGYIVFGAAEFGDAAEFGAALDTLIDRHGPETLPESSRLAFRPDLRFEALEGGFRLGNRLGHSDVRGAPWVGVVGKLVRDGGLTAGRIMDAVSPELASRAEVAGFLDGLFQAGLLD